MKARYFHLIALAALLWFTACTQQQVREHQAPAPKRYRIAYNVSMDTTGANYQIWSMNMDGSDKRNIIQHREVSWTYHADKDRLFFISDRDTCPRCFFLYEMDAFGKNSRRVSDLRLEDSWMSSRNQGKELVVSGRVGKEIRMQLFLIETESGKYRQLTNDTAAMFRDPAFSPDGTQIAFAYQAHKRDTGAHEELWIMNANGSAMRQLTHYPQNDPLRYQYGYKAGPPKWHPGENFISYQSGQGGKHSLFAVTSDGKRQWKLTENPQEEGWHDWSNDGNWLAVELFDSIQGQFYIGLMDWKTKELKVLTDSTYQYQHSPVFVEVGQ